MMLAGVPVLADAVAELAATVRATGANALADRLEVAVDDGVALLALTRNHPGRTRRPTQRARRTEGRAHERSTSGGNWTGLDP